MAKLIARVKTDNGVSFTVGKETVTVNTTDVHKDLIQKLLVHGLNAKVGDSAAGDKTDTDRLASIKNTIANLKKGIWSEGGGTGTGGMLAKAVAETQKISIEQAVAALDKLDDEKFAAVKNHPAVKLVMARLRMESAKEAAKAEGGDLTALLK